MRRFAPLKPTSILLTHKVTGYCRRTKVRRAAAGGVSEPKTRFFGEAILTQKTKFYV